MNTDFNFSKLTKQMIQNDYNKFIETFKNEMEKQGLIYTINLISYIDKHTDNLYLKADGFELSEVLLEVCSIEQLNEFIIFIINQLGYGDCDYSITHLMSDLSKRETIEETEELLDCFFKKASHRYFWLLGINHKDLLNYCIKRSMNIDMIEDILEYRSYVECTDEFISSILRLALKQKKYKEFMKMFWKYYL